MRTIVLLPLLVLAACGDAQQPAPAPSPSAPTEVAPLTSLEGDYEVTDVDDRGFAPTNAVLLHFAKGRIDFVNCQRIGWVYTFEDGKLTTDRSPPPGAPCKDKMDVRVLQMVSAIDAADEAERKPDGTIKLTGDLRSVTLASQ